MLARLHKKKCKKTGRTEKGRKEWKELDKNSIVCRGLKGKHTKMTTNEDVKIYQSGKKSWDVVNSKKSLSK